MTRLTRPLRLPDALTGRELVVVDVEGNGRQPPEIIELALLPLTTARATVDDLATWLVRPTRSITAIVTRKVHGITDSDVADAPPWTGVADEIAAGISGRVLVAHNATVERRVLGTHLPGWKPPAVLDTLRLAKAVWPGLPGGYGLDRLTVHAGLHTPPANLGGRHRAGHDVWLTAGLLFTLFDELADQGDLTWARLLTDAALPDVPLPDVTDQCSADAGLW
jgi:exodeoxyribonuclease X